MLTDLAGSERVKRSGVEGKAMQEAQAINKSLSALGNVVNGLYMESKHIPYRDSKLTRLLRRSFVDPGSRILLITNLSPTGNSFGESLSSLRFADRVKGLKAAAISAGDVVAEQEFLERLRVSEQIAADVRIAQGATEYKIQRPRTRRKDVLTNKDYLKECISEYSAQVKRVRGGAGAWAISGHIRGEGSPAHAHLGAARALYGHAPSGRRGCYRGAGRLGCSIPRAHRQH